MGYLTYEEYYKIIKDELMGTVMSVQARDIHAQQIAKRLASESLKKIAKYNEKNRK